jgi:uncharacterized protein (DUF58 family)
MVLSAVLGPCLCFSMLPKDLFDKVRRIEITTSHLVTDVFAGQYHSVFKGRGMEFDEVREYQFGDDVRTIDWNVTARTGTPHVKKFVEERELTVMIMVDVSQSCYFASVNQLKSKLAAEIAAILAFSAIRNNDKVGLIMFTDAIELFIPPRKGKSHVLRVIREVLYFKPRGKGTDLSQALEYLTRVTTRKTVAFVLSDFFESDSPHPTEPRYKKPISMANKRHDIIAITLNDPLERDLPDCGLVELRDAETGVHVIADSGNARIRKEYRRQALNRIEQRDRLFRSVGVDHIDVDTSVPYEKALVTFFRQRQQRIGS